MTAILLTQSELAQVIDAFECVYGKGKQCTAALAMLRAKEPLPADCTPNHLCNGRMVHLPLGEQCDKCGGSVQ
jgi:hypothetical protein